MYFVIYLDSLRQWRWTLFATNHRKIADCGEGYLNKADCEYAIRLVKGSAAATVLYR